MSSPPETMHNFHRKFSAPGDITELRAIKKKKGFRRRKSTYNSMLKYEAKTDDLKKTFSDVSESEKLIYDCSCALQKDILHQGRLYVCLTGFYFHANVFRKETQVVSRWTDVATLKRSKTALVIPNAILVGTNGDQTFLTSFASRDKVFLIMTRLWQLALKCREMPTSEVNLWTQYYYGEDLDLDDCNGSPTSVDKRKFQKKIRNQLKLLNQHLSDDVDQVLEEVRSTAGGRREGRGREEGDRVGSSVPDVPSTNRRAGDFQTDGDFDLCDDLSRGEQTDDLPPKSRSPSPLLRIKKNGLFPLRRYRSRSFEDAKNEAVKRNGSKASGKDKEVAERSAIKRSVSKDSLRPITFKVSQELPDVVVNDEAASEESGGDSDGVCQCGQHEELLRPMMDEVFPMSVNELFKKIFHNTHFWSKFLKISNAEDVVLTPWSKERDKSGAHVRNISYTLSLNYPFGLKHSSTFEKQILHADSNPGEFYLVDTECVNNGLPYGEDFYIANRYCISKISKDKCRIRITSQIKYKKKVWGLVKSFIEKNATSGILETFNIMGNLLKQEANQKDTDRPSGRVVNIPTRKKLLRKRSLEKVTKNSQQASSDENRETEGSIGLKAVSAVTSQTSDFVGQMINSIKQKHDQKWISNITFGHAVQIVTAFAVVLCLFNVFLFLKLWALETATIRFSAQSLSEKEATSSYEDGWTEGEGRKMEQWKDVLSSLADVMEEMAHSATQLKRLIAQKINRSGE